MVVRKIRQLHKRLLNTHKIRKDKKMQLIQFINQFDQARMQVRDRKVARKHRITQLRTLKNNHKAIVFDGLGNAFCLCNDGILRQLFENEINCFY